jgi:pimeloyl-ACP methyl ester carboxylesterase
VIAYANPLRTIGSDAAGLTELVRSINGPVVLAGHSYGGAVMTNVPANAGEIMGLVYVAAFALEAGESPGAASALAPGGRSPRHSRGCRCRAEAWTTTSPWRSSINSSAPICRPDRRSC